MFHRTDYLFFKHLCTLPNNLNLKTTTFPFISKFKFQVNELNIQEYVHLLCFGKTEYDTCWVEKINSETLHRYYDSFHFLRKETTWTILFSRESFPLRTYNALKMFQSLLEGKDFVSYFHLQRYSDHSQILLVKNKLTNWQLSFTN